MSLVTRKYLDEVTYEIIGAAIEVHKWWEEGFLKAYTINVWKKNYSIEK